MGLDISIFGSGHRPENWMIQCENIGENDVIWERIIVGPNLPNYTLPDNHRFVQSDVKPSQCFEIAARLAQADLILHLADDTIFKDPHSLDILYETYQSRKNDKLMVSPRFCIDRGDHIEDCSRHPTLPCHHFFVHNPATPILPVGPLYKKQLHLNLGGFDSQFTGVYYDLDLAMRLWAIGGEVILSEVYLIEDSTMSGGSHVNREFGALDRHFLDSLWAINNHETHLNRTQPVISFSDEKILEESQGPKGKWN